MKKLKILVANDDGIDALGIRALAVALSKKYEVVVAAPQSERSASSHSLTIFKPLSYKQVQLAPNIKAYSIDGTPVDCVKIGLLMLEKDVDVVISGINRGPNLGSDTIYSGTVSAAREGLFLGKRAIAVSQTDWEADESVYNQCAQFVTDNLQRLLSADLGTSALLNINYPAKQSPQGIKVVPLGINYYDDEYVLQPDKASYQLVGKPIYNWEASVGSDVEWAAKGFITLTPILFNQTDYQSIDKIKNIF